MSRVLCVISCVERPWLGLASSTVISAVVAPVVVFAEVCMVMVTAVPRSAAIRMSLDGVPVRVPVLVVVR
jgi:hypothetical protein